MINSDKEHFITITASHAGMTGKTNEDRVMVTHFWLDNQKRRPSVLAVLCDGIGGHRAGEVAAEIGVQTITETIAEGDPKRPLRTFEAAVQHANQAIFSASTSESGRQGMGTTCACAWLVEGRLYTMNLGDSRIYLLRDELIIQVTTDHTWIQEAIDAGILSDSAQKGHPNAHVIRRYLGSAKPPEPDFRLWFYEGEGNAEAEANQGLELLPGDILLLCSDGLTDLVADEEIQEVVQSLPLDQIPDRLISLANTRGGHDNITLVLLRYPGDSPKKRRVGRKKRIVLGCLVVLAFIGVLMTALFFGVRWRRETRDGTIQISPSASTPHKEDPLFPNLDETPMPSPTRALTLDEPPQGTPSTATRTPWPTNTANP
jgi:PPM family protein phosphatase